jgi:hypothetical protein
LFRKAQSRNAREAVLVVARRVGVADAQLVGLPDSRLARKSTEETRRLKTMAQVGRCPLYFSLREACQPSRCARFRTPATPCT